MRFSYIALKRHHHNYANIRSILSNFPIRHLQEAVDLLLEHIVDFDTTKTNRTSKFEYLSTPFNISLLTVCFPQLVPGAAGRSCVTHSSLTVHQSCEQISCIFEQTLTVSSVVLNCKRHCKSALYIAPAGRSGYVKTSNSAGESSKHFPKP